MNDLKKQYEQETERNPVYQIQPHDAGFKMPSLGYIKWLETKLQNPQPEGVKPCGNCGEDRTPSEGFCAHCCDND